jgi:hypothetical protein
MAQLSYSPDFINQYVSTIYCKPESIIKIDEIDPILICDDSIPVVCNVSKKSLVCVHYDSNSKQWIIHHNNLSYITDHTIIINTTGYGYDWTILAVIRQFNLTELELVELQIFDPENGIIYQNCNNYLENETDISDIFIHKSEIGFYHINPKNHFDFVFSTFMLDKNLFDYAFSEVAASNLKTIFKNISDESPLIDYSNVYKYIKDYDPVYYETKMNTFKNEITQFIHHLDLIKGAELVNFLLDFCDNLKNDFLFEMKCIYHRFRLYPSERIAIYKKYDNHPYIKLTKMIHKDYLSKYKDDLTFNKMVTNLIEKLIFKTVNNVLYNDNINLIVSGLTNRRELFCPVYECLIDTRKTGIQAKFKNGYDYFPFKIFSIQLFMMEHVLANN